MATTPKLKDLLERYDYFLFDWDGTVCSTWPLWFEFLVESAHTDYGLTHVTTQDVIDNMGQWNALVKLGYPVDKFDIDEYRERCDTHAPFIAKNAPMFEGVRDFIEKLKASGKTLAVVSSGTKNLISNSLEHNDLLGVFDVVICQEDVYAHKPDPEPILKALDLLKADKKRTLMIGDSVHDLVAAKRAGVDSMFFYPAEHYFIDKQKVYDECVPTYFFKNWDGFNNNSINNKKHL